jgi:cyanate permease
LGPVITGAIYDRYDSYAPMMSGLIALALIASCLYTLLVKPPLPSR